MIKKFNECIVDQVPNLMGGLYRIEQPVELGNGVETLIRELLN